MLQPAALEAWTHNRADLYVGAIDFIGVFIPFDRSWQAQIANVGGKTATQPTRDILSKAAFSTHLYRSFVGSLIHRVQGPVEPKQLRRVELPPRKQEELAKDLANLWQVKLRAGSLLGLKVALSDRLRAIGQLSSLFDAVDSSQQANLMHEQDPSLFSPFLEGMIAALDAWESCTNITDERWALAFDELELAPPKIKESLFSAMRSTDSRLLFKLALSPYDQTLSHPSRADAPQAGQDYDEILLWYAEKKKTEPFCRALWESMLRDRQIPYIPPRAAFGRSHFETITSEWSGSEIGTAYGPGSRASRRFEQLAEIDPSFRRYLRQHNLKASQLDRVPSEQRPSEVRKISPLVEARLFFLRLSRRERKSNPDRETATRSRKRLTLYAGWDTFCAVSEGNPRWFIGMANSLLKSADPNHLRIIHSKQADAIADAARRYRAALRTIPVSSGDARERRRGLLSILDIIAEYFRERQIEQPFMAEPPGSFEVDPKVSEAVENAISQALNAGAIVYVQDLDVETGTMDVRGKRYRLCYLLAASAGLMPRLARSVNLSSIVATREYKNQDLLQLPFQD